MGNGARFRDERALNVHIGRSEVCRSWITMQAIANQHVGAAHDSPQYDSEAMEVHDDAPHHATLEEAAVGEGDAQAAQGAEELEEVPASGDRAWLTRTFVGAGLRYPDPVGTVWEKRKRDERTDGNPYHPFKSDEAYDIAQWAIRTKQTMTAVNDFLKTRYVSR